MLQIFNGRNNNDLLNNYPAFVIYLKIANPIT